MKSSLLGVRVAFLKPEHLPKAGKAKRQEWDV